MCKFSAYLSPFLTAIVPRPKQSTGGDKQWEEPDVPEIPRAHGFFAAAWKKADKGTERFKAGMVDPGYRFPKLTLLVNVSLPERKKTYLYNWLSARSLWIRQIADHSLPKFPNTQMWRDFLNTIEGDLVPRTKSSKNKIAAREILGEQVVESAQGLKMAPADVVWRETRVRVFFFFRQTHFTFFCTGSRLDPLGPTAPVHALPFVGTV